MEKPEPLYDSELKRYSMSVESSVKHPVKHPVEQLAGFEEDVGPDGHSHIHRVQSKTRVETQNEEAYTDYPQHAWDHAERARPDFIDLIRNWSWLMGGLLGVLIVLLAFLMLQGERKPSQQNAPTGDLTAATGNLGEGTAQSNSTLPPAPIVGRYAPDFTLATLEGDPVKLSDFRGKPVWINFWATWCPPCRAEMPEMQQKYAKLKEKGLVILGVDVGEDADMVSTFISTNGFDWTFALDSSTDVSKQYRVNGIPGHFFVNKEGIIKAVQVGGLPANVMDRHLETIMDR